MSDLHEILKAKIKPKEKQQQVADYLQGDKKHLTLAMEYFASATDSEKGTIMGAITQLTKADPKFAGGCLDFVRAGLNHKAPRVKWEASETLGHAARAYPDQVTAAIPQLLKNTDDEGTVPRWSAAFALTEIAKHSPQARKKLLPLIEKKAEEEEQNGVRNLYVKALKAIAKL